MSIQKEKLIGSAHGGGFSPWAREGVSHHLVLSQSNSTVYQALTGTLPGPKMDINSENREQDQPVKSIPGKIPKS